MKGEVATLRKAALALAGMPAKDREWALQSLSLNRRVLLRQELLGLTKLGVSDEVIVSVTSAQFDATDGNAALVGNADHDVNYLNSLPSDRIREMLSIWPTKLRLAFITSAAWTWANPSEEALPGGSAKLTRRASEALVQAAAESLRKDS